MKGLILAGGKGTRLRPLTINTPKPIVPVANSPFLLYQIDLMRSCGIEEIILSLSYQPRKIEDLPKDGSDGTRSREPPWVPAALSRTPKIKSIHRRSCLMATS
jgi:NDP-sugar pyrophosphorylase family protein